MNWALGDTFIGLFRGTKNKMAGLVRTNS